MALQLWETLEDAITVYTGLTPATFFTGLALGLAIYYVLSSLFGSSGNNQRKSSRDLQEEMQPLPPPVQLGEVTEEELKVYDGSDPKRPLLMAIKGQIYDVTQSRMFYGPGGPYALFAGKDASRALAKMSFEEQDLTGDISGLGPFELDALQDWEYKFMTKYAKVGSVKKTVPVTDGTLSGEAVETTDRDVDDKPTDNGPSENAATGITETESAVDANKEE
ncbi:membrane steroid-binding protein 1-like [Camellia sinensis]|uniref:membrane steroid-binding protein 1-like n=1 Tax=Camellia sinensis TaxID=4442 RepID=UPI001035F819|nr:membrane steroid-binding protein 1-like [Camellia sinensis]